MCTTHSGVLVSPSNYGVPTIGDAAISLGRKPRFSGHTQHWWSVLHHLWVGDFLLRSESVVGPELGMLWLVHEWDEVIFPDLPTTWKTDEQRQLGKKLWERCMARHGLIELIDGASDAPFEMLVGLAGKMDTICLIAEMEVVGPPNVKQHAGLVLPDDTLKLFGSRNVYDVVRACHEEYPDAMSSTEPHHPLVHWYLWRYDQLTRRLEGARNEERGRATFFDPRSTGPAASLEDLLRQFARGDGAPARGKPD